MEIKKKVVLANSEVASKTEKKVEKISLVAKYKLVDRDGNKETFTFESEGSTIEDALGKMEFPKGANVLVVLKAQKGDKVIEKALAPHKARSILEMKDVVDFENAFRGL